MTSWPQRLTDGEQTIFFQAGGEWCYLRTPVNYKSAASTGRGVPCVIQCHGNGGYVREGAADWLDEAPKRLFVDTLVAAGIAVAGSYGTGNHRGRPAPGVGHATYQLDEAAARPITDFFRTCFSLER